jgi:glc operon protein GlcG
MPRHASTLLNIPQHSFVTPQHLRHFHETSIMPNCHSPRSSRNLTAFSFGTRPCCWLLIGLVSSAGVLLGLPHDASSQPPSDQQSPLISRERIELHLAGAETILDAARQKAKEMNLRVNIAVVDAGGHLLAFARMDGARPASVATALTKATTAATLRQATGPLPPGSDAPDVLLNLSIQNAAAASGGKFTTLFGGVPVVVEDQVIGAVGVGGATGEQDAEIARAGIDALLKMVE